jgi:hypothetical protein
VDCRPNPGGEASCLLLGCCWVPNPAHPYCFKPATRSNSTRPLSNASSNDDFPVDGTVLHLPATGRAVAIIASNPLAWNRTEVVSVRVRSNSPLMVLTDGGTGAVISYAQLAPPVPWNCSLNGTGSHASRHRSWTQWAHSPPVSTKASQLSRLVFRAALPALGTATFFLRSATVAEVAASVAISTVDVGSSSAGFELRNSRLSVRVSSNGLLDSAQMLSAAEPQQDEQAGRRLVPGAELRLGQDLKLYWGNGGLRAPSSNWDGEGGDGGSESDAYVFSPQGAAASLVRLSPEDDPGFWPSAEAKQARQTSTVSIKGPVMQEVSTVFAVGATKAWQAVRLHDTGTDDMTEMGIELAYLVEPLASNQDLVTRFSTRLDSGAVLHADEAAWTDRAQPLKLDFDSMPSKIGEKLTCTTL